MRNIYIHGKGGLGYTVSLARFIQSVNPEKYKFFVCSPYWDIFAAAGIGYYKAEEVRDWTFDAVNDENSFIVENRIYDLDKFIRKEIDYFEAWRILCQISEKDCDKAKYNKLVLDPIKAFPNTVTQNKEVQKTFEDKKMFMLVQFCGGQSPLDVPPDGDWTKKPYNYEQEPLKRHYPTDKATEFVKLFKAAHPDIELVQYTLPNEPIIEGCQCYALPYMTYYNIASMPNCIGAITIDSSLAHLITGQTKVMTIWGHSLPNSFGYSCNKNIIQKCRRDDILYFTELGPSGAKIVYIEPEALLKEVDSYFELVKKEDVKTE